MNESKVILDSCVIDRFAEVSIYPVSSLRDSEFHICYTPDLRAEYVQKMESDASPDAKRIAQEILEFGDEFGDELGFFGFSEEGSENDSPFSGWGAGIWAHKDQIDCIDKIPQSPRIGKSIPKNRTDAHLVALARDFVVVTQDKTGSHWKKTPVGPGKLIQWGTLKDTVQRTGDLATSFRELCRK